jgi:hypothetical protein
MRADGQAAREGAASMGRRQRGRGGQERSKGAGIGSLLVSSPTPAPHTALGPAALADAAAPETLHRGSRHRGGNCSFREEVSSDEPRALPPRRRSSDTAPSPRTSLRGAGDPPVVESLVAARAVAEARDVVEPARGQVEHLRAANRAAGPACDLTKSLTESQCGVDRSYEFPAPRSHNLYWDGTRPGSPRDLGGAFLDGGRGGPSAA